MKSVKLGISLLYCYCFTTLVKELSFGVPLGQIYLKQGQRPTDKKIK
jgi:hypothetical protein